MTLAPCGIHLFARRVQHCHVCARVVEETADRQRAIIASRYRISAAAKASHAGSRRGARRAA